MSRELPIPSAQLRHRLTIQQEVHTSDGAGGHTRSWQTVADVWAQIVPLGSGANHIGREKWIAEQLQSEVTHRVWMRYRADVRPDMRLRFENRVFNIRYVINSEEKDAMLSLLVQEGVAP